MLRFNDIVDRVQGYNPKADILTLQKAYVFSAKVHAGQTRVSGEPYLVHPTEVAGILTQMKLDVPSIATGFLHDTVEDTLTSLDEVRTLFGDEIADLVDSVTKLGKVQFKSKEERQAENFRKMLLATSKDIRVILIKLADRLHNMRTIESLPPEKQARIAQETIAIYAPIANRLGLQWIKTELEDLVLQVLQPEIYKELESNMAAKQKERQAFVDELCESVRTKLADQKITASVYGRAKHYYSIYKKMKEKDLAFEEIYDVIAFRVLVSSVRECYETLGLIHSLWKPVPGKVKDYIALPKTNMYQSLHTSVIGPYGQPMEFQIRTHEMHEVAEYGIAAHWQYKEGRLEPVSKEQPYSWLRQMLTEREEVSDPDEYMDSLRVDLFPEEVYVFTPQGDVKVLPQGATPVDFAYAVHTEIGNTCIGAKVNGRIVPLNYELNNGEIITIQTRKGQTPTRDWLQWVKTAKARQRIREHIRVVERQQSLALGHEIVEKELERYGTTLDKELKKGQLDAVAEKLGHKDAERLLIAVSFGTAPLSKLIEELIPAEKRRAEEEKAASPIAPLQRLIQRVARPGAAPSGVRIKGDAGDVMVRYAGCCNPLPGDKIVGFITRGRGITVHRNDCTHVHEMIPERRIAVEWDKGSRSSRPVKIEVVCVDRPGLLASMSKSITTEEANITRAEIHTTIDEKAVSTFEIMVRDADHLKRIVKALERIRGVYSVHRIDGGREAAAR